MARPPLRIATAPHEFFRRPPFPVLPHEMMQPRKLVPAPCPPPPDEGLQLSDLERIGYLGEGASGVVTKMCRRRTGAMYALKKAYSNQADQDREAEALQRCAGSPHVVTCHAFLRGADGERAFALELMDCTLGAVLRSRGSLPEPALAEVAARCLQGLAHVHYRGVAHLDLRPDNILANARGEVKISDFSVSQILHGRAGERCRVSIAVGALAYMSPERFEPNARASPGGAIAADVWGFGITILELFMGRCPTRVVGEKEHLFAMMKREICEKVPPRVPDDAAASPELRAFVTACLQEDPKKRATVAQLLAHPFVTGRHVEVSRHALRTLIVETMRDE